MNTYWLLILYILLVPINGARLFLLAHVLDERGESDYSFITKVIRYRSFDIEWYKWMYRYIKDWFLLGLLGAAAVVWLEGLLPHFVLGIMMLLGLLLLFRLLAPSVLLLYSVGVGVPAFFITRAICSSIPDYVPSNPRRILFWSGAFLLAGTSGIYTWAGTQNPVPLVWSFITLTLGFTTIIRLFTGKREMEDNINAEKAG